MESIGSDQTFGSSPFHQNVHRGGDTEGGSAHRVSKLSEAGLW